MTTGADGRASGAPPVAGTPAAGLRSGEVAAAAGVNRQTLRFYERRGLIAPPERSLGGHRRYPPDTPAVLRGIKAAQRLGFTLNEIAGLLAAGRPATGLAPRSRPGADLGARARAKLTEITARIVELEASAEALRAALDAGCTDLATCASTSSCPLPFGDAAPRRP
ncbi:MerR family transcriptional regulator [Plantactinospora siamensis]|uniref:MerR family transcriptional regulator n=1 Tax=Plantactinospora siamensis TaxID=555372 RepID=A0ABV6NYS1_9ACTN